MPQKREMAIGSMKIRQTCTRQTHTRLTISIAITLFFLGIVSARLSGEDIGTSLSSSKQDFFEKSTGNNQSRQHAQVQRGVAQKLFGSPDATSTPGPVEAQETQSEAPKAVGTGRADMKETAPVTSSFALLSPSLERYLDSIGPNVGAVVYDVTHQQTYTYNGTASYLTASSIKIPIMLTYLDQLEQQGQAPDDQGMNLLSSMIENSDNDSASELYYNQINGATGINNFLRKSGITGIQADNTAWGYSETTPQAMVDLLTRLHNGSILQQQDRALALNLMENIESDQQQGVGDTAPNGATVAMKDGWVPADDGLWTVNSSGIVTTNNETYILAVYTQEQPSLEDGQHILQHICSQVAMVLA